MIHQVSARLLASCVVALLGLLIGIATGRPEIVLLVAPVVAVVVGGSIMHEWPELTVGVRAAEVRAVEGDDMEFLVEIRSSTGVPWLEIDLELPPDFEAVAGSSRLTARVPPGSAFVIPVRVRLVRWGIASPRRVSVKARDRFGLYVASFVQRVDCPVRIHPTERSMRALLTPPRLRSRLGNHTSTARGSGADYSDVRPIQVGDRARTINWRVTARRGEPWVTERHPERSADVVLFVDRLHWVGEEADTTVQLAVRAALSLADSHVGAQDRVGLLDVGRDVRWFRPRLGRTQLYRLIDALLEIELERALGGPTVEMLPLRSLSPGTQVIALSSLLDARPLALLHELRSRGYEVAVIECEVGDRVPRARDRAGRLARRLWAVERAATRAQLRSVGIPVAQWDEHEPLTVPLAAINVTQGARRGAA